MRMVQKLNKREITELEDRVAELAHLPTRVCPIVERYKFKLCDIRTCKNWSDVTECKCLAIDRVGTSGIKIISDAEINLLKFGKKDVTTRSVAMKRKIAIDRVKCMLILKKYLDFIIDKYEKQGEDSSFISGKYVQLAQTVYPLSTKRLNFKNWIWHFLVDDDVYKEFIDKQQGGECTEFKIEQLLSMTSLRYKKVLKEITESK